MTSSPLPRRRRRAGVIIAAIIALLLAAVAYFGWRAYTDAMSVGDRLAAAMTEFNTARTALSSGDTAAVAAAADAASAQIDVAQEIVASPTWGLAAAVPSPISDDMQSLRVVVDVADSVVGDALGAVGALDLSALAPEGGGLDLAKLHDLSDRVDGINATVDDAVDRIDAIDQDGLLGPVRDGVARIDEALVEAQSALHPLAETLRVLPAALGEDAPRRYLLMFQGNSEARSLGGNAAVFIVLTADAGKLTITDQVNSSDFHHRDTPIVELDPQAVAIYGDKIGRYTPDFTMIPDYAEAVRVFRGWWEDQGKEPFDASISIDPIALSRLLQATGPLALPSGDVLDVDSAVPLLLNGVYYKYSDPTQQNVFFMSAAQTVFSALVGGQAQPMALLSAIVQSTNDGRILYDTTDETQSSLLAGARVLGEMPASNESDTVIGVYVNDNTGSKKSYYLDMAIDARTQDCTASGRSYAGTATFTSRLIAEEAARLPAYIAGPYFAPNIISTYVVVYGPVGGTLDSITIDGQPATVLSQGEHLGRPAVKVEVQNDIESVHTVDFSFSVEGDGGPMSVWHTPMTRETPVTVTDTCK